MANLLLHFPGYFNGDYFSSLHALLRCLGVTFSAVA